MTTAERWKTFWSTKLNPLHPSTSDEFYRLHAIELRILFGDKLPERVLELGCSDGAMFQFLGFDRVKYKGVDFSPHLLDMFKAKYPNVELECCEASTYVDREYKYDLIFSNAVVQYFDMPMVDSHFACAREMMHRDSLFVCGSIPWRHLRSYYHAGGLHGTNNPSMLRLAKSTIATALFGDTIGYWYELREIASLADKHGFSVRFYGSILYMYRFHAVMRLK